jgi:exopolysaccharide biosynthesis polyprenyl glycosylphosphotransferase
MDVLCLLLGSTGAVLLRFPREEMGEYVFGHIDGWLVLLGGVILANYLAGSYRLQYTFSRFNLFVTWAFSLLFALVILSMTSYAWFRIILGRGVLFLSFAFYSMLSLALKLVVYRILFRSPMFLCRAVVLGEGSRIERVRRMLENPWVLPAHRVVACIRVPGCAASQRRASAVGQELPIVEVPDGEVEAVIRRLDASLIVLAIDDLSEARRLYPQLRRLRFEGVEVLTPLMVAEIYSGRTPLDEVSEEFLMLASMESRLPLVRQAKRILDILAALVGLVVAAPILAAVGLAIKLTEPSCPVLYSQERVGQFGKRFRILKFRTMRVDAERETGPVWAGEVDHRITPLGRFLRKYRLDELPQLINILKGEMSLVGPRPERPEIIQELSRTIPYYDERHNLLPGLTGWAQIQYPYGATVDDARRKLEYDLYYLKHLSLSLDLQIILRTLRIILFGLERDV